MSNNLGKRGRGLDPAVMSWLMSTLKIGPGIGDVHFAVGVDTAYYSYLRDDLKVHAAKIHHSIDAGHDALVANRNDVLCVYPGNYTGTGAAPLTWSKDHTHLVGMCNPQRHEYGGRGVIIRTLSTSGVFAIQNTADVCQFHNTAFQQLGEDAACLTAFRESGHMNLFKGCHIFGQIRSDVSALTTSSSLEIDGTTLRAGSADTFIDCVIGGSGGAKRTAKSGTMLLTSSASILGVAVDIKFIDSMFMSWMEDDDPSAVLFAGNFSADRLLHFKNCGFYNFNQNHAGSKPNWVFQHAQASNQTHDVILEQCWRLGFDYWCNQQVFVFATGPVGASDGGQATAADVA